MEFIRIFSLNENPKLQGHTIYDDLYRDINIEIPAEAATDPYRFISKNIMDQNKGRANTYAYDYDLVSVKEHHMRYYKLLEYYENGTVQLFNLKTDIEEQYDLSYSEPEKANDLRNRLHKWRQEVNAQMMLPNPDFVANVGEKVLEEEGKFK